MDMLELLVNGDPQRQQMLEAQALRGRQALQQALDASRQQAGQYDLMNFAATAAGNNPNLAKATQSMAATQHSMNTMQPVGQAGMIVGGKYLQNPDYAYTQDENRQGRMLSAASMLEARREALANQTLMSKQLEEGRNERAQQGNALRQSIAELNAGRGNDAKDAARQQAADKFRQQSAQRYATTLEHQGIPEFDTALNDVEELLAKYPTGKLPGVGRVAGMVPNALLDAESQNVRSTLQVAANVLLKARSGTAVTDNEMRRYLTEAAQGGGFSEEAFRKSIDRLRQRWDKHVNNFAAGFSPEIRQEFVDNGGLDFTTKGHRVPGAPPEPTKVTPVPAQPTPNAAPGHPKVSANTGSRLEIIQNEYIKAAARLEAATSPEERHRAEMDMASTEREIRALSGGQPAASAPAKKRIKVDINGDIVP